ncbi:hypothetical protein K3495_g1972 [Podosphaera aphanis]|nr:hypothetical protein K3495_g1972 [Podosphaera aphanis]
MTAAEELLRIEQGAHQYFGDFLKDFEYKVAQSGRNSVWTATSRVNMLNSALNKKLRKALIAVKLPPARYYQEFVTELKEVAGKLEAFSDYRPKGSTQAITKLGSPKSGNSLFVITAPQADEEDDIIMGGTNALVTSISHLAQSRLEEKLSVLDKSKDKKRDNGMGGTRKPQASWRSKT